MMIMPSFKKKLIVEQFQGNYLNGFELKGRFLQVRTKGDNLCSMFYSVCCLFHAKPCRLSHCEESSVLLTIYYKLLCKP